MFLKGWQPMIILVAFYVLIDSAPVTIFQAIDSSFFHLWLNWWAVAIELKAFPETWGLHLACFGDEINKQVKLFHGPGPVWLRFPIF